VASLIRGRSWSVPSVLLSVLVWAAVGCVDELSVLRDVVADAGRSDDGAPSDVGGPPPALEADVIALGRAHSLALRDRSVFGWGNGSRGLFTQTATSTFVEPRRLFDGAFVHLDSGEDFACGIDPQGAVGCWGDNRQRQLGRGEVSSSPVPLPVALPFAVEELGLGFDFACARSPAGEVWCWGQNAEGQLGRDDTPSAPAAADPAPIAEPGPWSHLAASDGHACAIDDDTRLWCWGRNTNAQLGLGPGADIQVRRPEPVVADRGWVSVVCGQFHSCAIHEDGSLWCWGDNRFGQLGLSGGATRSTPEAVNGIGGRVVQVSASAFATCALNDERRLWCWGRNLEGQLGVDTPSESFEPILVPLEFDVMAVDLGRFHTCILSPNRFVSCTGAGADGRLGNGDRTGRSVFTPTTAP
jgi:alpha-tubulin suppressor-like RCC1 family protein